MVVSIWSIQTVEHCLSYHCGHLRHANCILGVRAKMLYILQLRLVAIADRRVTSFYPTETQSQPYRRRNTEYMHCQAQANDVYLYLKHYETCP